MPTKRNNDFKIRAGLHTSLSDTYLISALPIQTDMGRAKWSAPQADGTTEPQSVELVDVMNGDVLPNGETVFQWTFSYWTFGQYKYWCDTFLPNKAYSADVTVVVFNDFDEEVTYQAVMQHRYLEDRAKAVGGFANVMFRFVDAVEVEP